MENFTDNGALLSFVTEIANLVRVIHTDVAVVKERQSRSDKIWESLETRQDKIELKLTEIKGRLETVEEYQEGIQQTSSFWRELFTTKALDLFISAVLVAGGFLLGHFIDMNPDKMEIEIQPPVNQK